MFSFPIWILRQKSLTRQLGIRVVGFKLKKLFTHFKKLIVSHALHCLNGLYYYFVSFLTVCYTVLVSVLDKHVSVKQLKSVKKLKRMIVYYYM